LNFASLNTDHPHQAHSHGEALQSHSPSPAN